MSAFGSGHEDIAFIYFFLSKYSVFGAVKKALAKKCVFQISGVNSVLYIGQTVEVSCPYLNLYVLFFPVNLQILYFTVFGGL